MRVADFHWPGMPAVARALTPSRRWQDWLVKQAIHFAAIVTISLIVLIFVFVGREALPVLTSAAVHKEVTLHTLFLPQNYGSAEAPLPYVWQPVSEVPKYSLMPLLFGTLKVTLVAMLFAVPLSILAAIYSAEFAPFWLREVIKPSLSCWQGFPPSFSVSSP